MSTTVEQLGPGPDDPIVVTGVGLATPLGNGREFAWQELLSQRSSARWLNPAELGLPDLSDTVSAARWMGCAAELPMGMVGDRVAGFARSVAREAASDARLTSAVLDPVRFGCVFGTSKGSLFAASAQWLGSRSSPAPVGNSSAEACFQLLLGPAIAAEAVGQDLGALGPRLSPVAACATGVVAVIRAAELVRRGECDVVIAGSADDSLHPLVLASFQKLGVLAQHADPEAASRPFDRDRTGFVIGSGAGALVLERRSHAQARGCAWYAELGVGRVQSDPTGMTGLDESGNMLARLIAATTPRTPQGHGRVPDVLNLHGTGTRLNDPAECRAVQRVYGPEIHKTGCGSLKGALGHMLGAAGSVELGFCCLMLRDQIVPANVNLQSPDDECRLPWVFGSPQKRHIESILKLSLGFGGHQAALWLERGNRAADR